MWAFLSETKKKGRWEMNLQALFHPWPPSTTSCPSLTGPGKWRAYFYGNSNRQKCCDEMIPIDIPPPQCPKLGKQNKRLIERVEEQRLWASLKFHIKSHVWILRNKYDEVMMTLICCNLTAGDATKLNANFKLDAARRQMNELLTDTTCVMRLKLPAKCTN